MLVHKISLSGHKKSTCCLRPLTFLETESLLCFGIGGPKFFPRDATTMTLKCFAKLCIIVYFIGNIK